MRYGMSEAPLERRRDVVERQRSRRRSRNAAVAAGQDYNGPLAVSLPAILSSGR